MKIFISQPMNGKTDEEIFQEREDTIKLLKKRYGEDIEIINSYINNPAPSDANPPVYYLGESIKLLSQADLVYFIDGWNKARGCKIEYIIASEYGINIEI